MGKRKERLDLHARRKLTRVEEAYATGHDVRVGRRNIMARDYVKRPLHIVISEHKCCDVRESLSVIVRGV